jgi:DNA ligase-associated metallophosphoesterase
VLLRPERVAYGDYDQQPIALVGKSFIADRSGALYWPAERMLIVADLHLEKGSHYAQRGLMLPPYDTRETLVKLAEAIERFEPDIVLSLGDGLHDPGAFERMGAEDREILRILQDGRRWIWVTGNHDPCIADGLGGEVVATVALAGLTFRHEPRPGPVTHEIAGHLHPAAKLSIQGATIRRPCFVGNRLRLVLPAFGAFTGGLNVLDDAFAALFGASGLDVWMLGQEGLYPVATRQLRGD